MNGSSRINFEALRREGLRELFEISEPIFEELNIDFYLIGAIARDAWEGIRVRATTDIDMALLIGDAKQYQQVREKLK